jgi:ferritin-like metal-binding protein YciE
MKTLNDLFLDELADMYDAEHQLVKALPKLAKTATCPDLKRALLAHLKETEGHVWKLEQVFQSFDESPTEKICETTKSLVQESGEIAKDFKDSPAINAALISAAQKVEHHEIASYGCLHEWAGLLGNPKAAGLLQEILAEEKAANAKLTELARASNNEEGLGESDEDESDEAPDKSPERPRREAHAVSASANRGHSRSS